MIAEPWPWADLPRDLEAEAAEFHALTDPRDPPDPADLAHEREERERAIAGAGLARANLAAQEAEAKRPLTIEEARDLAAIEGIGTMDRLGARLLSDVEPREPSPLLIDRLDPEGHTILFGAGGCGKGTIAAWWIARLAAAGYRVLILDYESHADEWARRVDGLGGPLARAGVLWVAPLAAAWQGTRGPLWRQARDIRTLATAWRADYLVVDSIVPACGATDPTKPEAASQYAGGLEYIGLPALSLAHVPKVDAAPLYPFGSAFWHNLARTTWSVTKSGENAGHVVTLAHRKHNNYASLGKFTVTVEWIDGAPREVWEQGYSAALAERIDAALGTDALTVRELVARIDEDRDEDDPATKPDSVRAALRRGLRAEAKRYTVDGTGDGAKWSRTA